MARTFDQVLADVTAQSDPQRQAILSQIADLPNQQTADEASLNAQKDQAYQDILSGARQRGLGFSGIPLGEQAKYNATSYAPALAKLKSNYVSQRGNLSSALAGIGSSDYATANNVFNQEQQLAEQQREFNANLAAQKAASSASSASLAALLGGGTPTPPAAVDPYAGLDSGSKNAANVAIKQLLVGNNVNDLVKNINGITKSANNGNLFDKYKLDLLTSLQNTSSYGPLIAKAFAAYKAGLNAKPSSKLPTLLPAPTSLSNSILGPLGLGVR